MTWIRYLNLVNVMIIPKHQNHHNVLLLTFIYCYVSAFTTSLNTDIDSIPSVFPSRLSPPGIHSPNKAWWAKEITPEFHVAGRLSQRQIKYAAEAGFKSILSLFGYPEDCSGDCGGVYLPVTSEEKVMVEDVAGLQFVSLLDPLDEWSSVEAVEKFTAIVPSLKTPALLHCDRGYTIAFVVLLYLANQTKHNENFEHKIGSQDFYDISASMGLDFLSRIPMEVVSEVTGEPKRALDDPTIPKPQFVPEEWLEFWVAHPVYYNWFSVGQIYKSHLKPIEEYGYKVIINVRNGVTSQEEVNLLNIRSLSDTHTCSDEKSRTKFTLERLEASRIWPERPNSYISETSPVNYESLNSHEFGDESGYYNETLERQAAEGSGLLYFHLPLDVSDSSGGIVKFEEYMAQHKDTLLDIGRKGPVLIHCSSGRKATYIAVLAAALQYDHSLDWALRRLKEMGFGVAENHNQEIYNVYKKYLLVNSRVEL